MTSQLSQPSSSISARVVGRNGAIPKRCAQYGRYENSGFDDTAPSFSTLGGAVREIFLSPGGWRYWPPSQGSDVFLFLSAAPLVRAGGGGVGGGAPADGIAAEAGVVGA